ncbi:MAG: class I adenylate-forming enzyme family protein [Steroidobacteraceae bacterium]|nr:acyl--CoA ligase [Steroidobacteraceae bacterium]MBP7012680.1 acyl--CoA ligase [Steroidobacteraceae bacterium]
MDAITRALLEIRERLLSPGAPFELTEVEVGGQKLPAFRHAKATLPELINVGRAHGEKPFIVYQGEVWSFARVFAEADAVAWALKERFGVEPGDRVAIAMRNRPEWVVAFLGAVLAGAVPAPINSFGLRDELLWAFGAVQPKVLFLDADRLQRLGEEWRSLGAEVVVADSEPAPGTGVHAWREVTQPARQGPPAVKVGPQDPALLLFTSGASARPKAVLTTHLAVCQAIMNIDYIGALSAMSSPSVVEQLMRRALAPTTLTVVPLFHISGLHAQLLTNLVNGRKLVFMHRWDPAKAIELIVQHAVTQFNAAPTMVMQILEHSTFDFGAVRRTLAGVGFGGAGLPQRLIEEVLEGLGPSMSGIGFGMTETSGVTSAMSGDAFRARPTSSGTISPIIEIRIVDADDRPLPEGERGEIQVRGVPVMSEYWGQPEATAAALRDGWLRTGDVGYLKDGYLFVVDRLKNVINRAGEKIAAAEVESCLLEDPALAEAAVLPIPDPVYGEAVAAVVVPVPGAATTEAELRAFVASRLAAYKVPSRIIVRREPLPKNPTGKLLKNELRRWFDEAS